MADISDELLELLEDHFRRDVGGQDVRESGYYDLSKEPDDWKLSGKLVRLSVAVQALHLMTARICFRSLPQSIIQEEELLKAQFRRLVENTGAFKLLGKLAFAMLNVVEYLMDIFNAEKAARRDEQTIRRRSIQTMREVRELYMGAGKQPRKKHTRRVWTRHKQGSQRKENQAWQQPRLRT